MALPFSLLIKPTGSDCNLNCKYCFYLSRNEAFGKGIQRMSDAVLEKLIQDYLRVPMPVYSFAWQGGEPTLMGLDFYKKVIELQKKYSTYQQVVENALQTNGILLNDEFCKFLAENNFLVGISIDGPKEIHDYYRTDRAGHDTFDRVYRAIEKCKEHQVAFNTLTLLSKKNVEHPDLIFDFLKNLGIQYIQFIPCVEIDPATGQMAEFSITAEQYGRFLCRLFDRWYEHGPSKISVRIFDSLLCAALNRKQTECTFDKKCNQYIVIEHTGDAFSCDFFVDDDWFLGNIMTTPVEELAWGKTKQLFARKKQDIHNKCLVCRYLAYCRGGCLKHRILLPSADYKNPSYFCDSYKQLFEHAIGRLSQIAAYLSSAHGPRGKVKK